MSWNINKRYYCLNQPNAIQFNKLNTNFAQTGKLSLSIGNIFTYFSKLLWLLHYNEINKTNITTVFLSYEY